MRWILTLSLAALAFVFMGVPTAAAQSSRQDLQNCFGEATAQVIIESCTRVIANDRTNRAGAYQNRGRAYHYMQQNDLALADANEAIRRSPAASAYRLRGSIHHDLGDCQRASADFSEAFRLNPQWLQDVNLLMGRAICYSTLGEHRRAISDYDRIISIGASDPTPYVGRGQAYGALGDSRRALADFDEAIRRFPNEYRTYQVRAQFHMSRRNYAEAIADYDAGARRGDGRFELRNSQCWARAVAGVELDTARTHCDRALVSATNDPADRATVLDSRGLVGLKQSRWQQAWDDYDAAVRIAPDDPHYLYGRGIAALRLGRTVEGRADISRARGLDARIAETYAGYSVRP